ncbi:hypothetical protein PoB_006671000 [Plakobranchus ocellatus]|uniref:Uncharacterized protein n=1 Tax=Plakobranchus ocellatus TaxID=259542 RepID=A0AAV4D809_9GAST|nr:hypothetical protein PoB_006671000 [Plakobranchus ocellatus]
MCIRCFYKLFGLDGADAASDDGLMLQGAALKRSSFSRGELSHVNGGGVQPIPSNKYGVLSGPRASGSQLSERTRQLQWQSRTMLPQDVFALPRRENTGESEKTVQRLEIYQEQMKAVKN